MSNVPLHFETGAPVGADKDARAMVVEKLAGLAEIERQSYVNVPIERTDNQILATLLEEILYELRRGNSAERAGAVSSVEIEDAAKGAPRVTTKRYTGSDPEVDQAIEDHTRAHVEAERRWKADWQQTLTSLKGDAA